MEKIKKENFVIETEEAMRDIFIANIEKSMQGLIFTFLNGQRFEIIINEL